MSRLVALALLAMAVSLARRSTAQPTSTPSDSARWFGVHGSIIDGITERPVAGALLELYRLTGAASSSRRVRTDQGGRYDFAGIAAGDYRLDVRAIGFVSRSVRLRLGEAAELPVHIGLRATPKPLEPIRVDASRPLPLTLERARGADAERQRQRRYLASDARTLTGDDLDGLGRRFGEPDPLTALRWLPGVTTRDDYTVAPWSRGAPIDQTLISLDGIPLYNAVHAVGALGGFHPGALGEITYLPTAAPAAIQGAGASTLLATTRAGNPDVAGAASVGITELAIAIRAEGRGDHGNWIATARRSTVDLLAPRLSSAFGGGTARLPYAFDDATLRGDLRLRDGLALRVVGLRQSDRLWGDVPRIIVGGRGRWGTHAGHLTLTQAFRGGTLRYSASASDMRASLEAEISAPLDVVGESNGNPVLSPRERAFQAQPIASAIRYTAGTVAWESAPDDAPGARTSIGAQLVSVRASLATAGLWPHSSQVVDSVRITTSQPMVALWGERRWHPRPSLAVIGAVRGETGPRPRNAGPVRLAPQLTARLALDSATALSVSFASAFQYAQAIAPAGSGRNAVAATGALWVVAGSEVPVLFSRTGTLGVERWLGPGTLASATAYLRNSVGVLVPDPRPGSLVDRPLATQAEQHGRGLEVSIRRFGRGWTGGTGIAASRSTLVAQGLRYAAPTNRPWTARADVALPLRLGGAHDSVPGRWRAGLAYEVAAPAPFTRYHEGLIGCGASTCAWTPAPRIGPPSLGRGDVTERLRVALTGQRTFGGRATEFAIAVENAAGARNDAAYIATVGRCAAGAAANPSCHPQLAPSSYEDVRLRPLGVGVSVALRVVF